VRRAMALHRFVALNATPQTLARKPHGGIPLATKKPP